MNFTNLMSVTLYFLSRKSFSVFIKFPLYIKIQKKFHQIDLRTVKHPNSRLHPFCNTANLHHNLHRWINLITLPITFLSAIYLCSLCMLCYRSSCLLSFIILFIINFLSCKHIVEAAFESISHP